VTTQVRSSKYLATHTRVCLPSVTTLTILYRTNFTNHKTRRA